MNSALNNQDVSHWLLNTTRDNTEDVTLPTHSAVVYNAAANTSSSIVGKEVARLAEQVIDCGFLPAACLIGLPANIINMVVFYRQGLRDKMNLCLFTLAFVDFTYLFFMFISTFYCLAAFVFNSFWEQVLKWYIRKYVVSFVYAFWYCSGTLTAIIATERCICVLLPMKSATIFTTKSMACPIFGAIIVINLLSFVTIWKHFVTWETDHFGNPIVVFKPTTFFRNYRFIFHFIIDIFLPIVSFVSFFVVFTVTVVTVRQLQSALQWRQSTGISSGSTDKRQLTLVTILIAVSCVYIACNAPQLSLAVVRFLMEEFSPSGQYHNLFLVTHRAGHLLSAVNSSVNVFIYCRQSSRFRQELKRMGWLCCRVTTGTSAGVDPSVTPHSS